jgi:hypothetical protein
MPKRILRLLIVVLTMAGCAAGSRPTAEPILLPPAHLTELPPASLPDPESGQLDDLTANHIETAGIYHRTRERFKALVEWLEKTRELR